MDTLIPPVLAVVHVGSALMFSVGYVATNVFTELARRTLDPTRLRLLLELSDVFDARLSRVGGTLVAFSGLLLLPVVGHRLAETWVILSIGGYAVLMLLGIVYWARRGRVVGAALAAGEGPRVQSFLAEPRSIVVSRLENALFAGIVVLMVLRPA